MSIYSDSGTRNWGIERFLFLILVLLSLIAGAAVAVLPWHWIVAATIVPCLIALAWMRPEIAVLLLLAMLFGVIPSMVLPSIQVGGGRLNAEDIGIPLLLLCMLLKHRGKLRERFSIAQAYFFPIGLFVGSATLSVFIAFLYKTAPMKDALIEFRPYLTWLLLPLCCLVLSGEKEYRRFLFGLLVLAMVLASGMALQSFYGVRLFDKGQEIRALYTVGSANVDVMRSTTPGMFLMASALIYLLAQYAVGDVSRRIFVVFCSIALTLGLIVGFGRGMWLSVIVGVGLIFFITKPSRYFRFIIGFFIVGSVGILSFYAAKPVYVEAAVNRLLSIGEEIEVGSSFNRRKEENYFAWKAVIDSPITGVGLGGRYKPDNSESIVWEAQSRYVHNSYVNSLVKMGFPGLAISVFMALFIMLRLFRNLRSAGQDIALSYSAFWLVLTASVFTSFTQPNFVSANGVASICIAIYVSERSRIRSVFKNNADARYS